MIDTPVHGLTFGDLIWVEDGANPPDSSGIVYRVRAQDASLGVAVPVTTALLWLGRAGGPVAWDNTPNREPVFRVTIEADDSNLLARGERALQLQAEQPCELKWTPPDGAGETSVFDIVWSHIEPQFDADGLTGLGMEETVLRSRTYLVRMQALPYPRSADLVVTPAQPTAVTTLIDDGSSATGWSVVVGASVSSSGGAIVLTTNTPVTGGFRSSYAVGSVARAGAVSLSSDRYLKVRWTASTPPDAGVAVQLDDPSATALQEVARNDGGSGYFESYYALPAGTTSAASLQFSAQWHPRTTAQTFSIDSVHRSTALPFIGTARQKALSLVPGGSVKTQGSIQVAHDTDALGKTIVYTHPSGTGYLPPLRPWRASSPTVTADTTLLSGSRNLVDNGTAVTTYRIPESALPKGRAEVWAWLRSVTGSGSYSIDWAIASYMGSASLSYTLSNVTVGPLTLNQWMLVPLGAAVMPPIDIGPSGYVEVHLGEGGVATNNIEVDEAYLFATDEGSLTVVDCGTGAAASGGPSNRLWIDAPSLDAPMGAIYRGNAVDRSDQWHAGSVSDVWGDHQFAPLGASIFVATANALDASTALTHYRRSHTYVARET